MITDEDWDGWPAVRPDDDPERVGELLDHAWGRARDDGTDPGGIISVSRFGTVTVTLSRVLNQDGWRWIAEATSGDQRLTRCEAIGAQAASRFWAALHADWSHTHLR